MKDVTSAMSFLLSSGAADQATEWASLTADQRTTIKTSYAAAGISLVVSAFGGTEQRQYTIALVSSKKRK